MEKSLRINTNVGEDKVVYFNMEQDVDTLDILSLKLQQTDLYRFQEANYGVIVGRVLANDAFGVQNARLSLFVKVNEEEIKAIKNLYPYTSTSSYDKNNVIYNLLPSEANNDCYRVVGTLPGKEKVLDDDIQLEIYDKYLKFSTVTNGSGDYMFYGVPTGSQEIHMSLDLSDIGVLSQKPIDFIFKGYNENEFENPGQFKASSNLAELPQIKQQNQVVQVYPFWGEREQSMCAITRADIKVDYKFEPTCVFIGSIVSDNTGNALGHKCQPSKRMGHNRQLVAGTGTIEMIRKTVDGYVEEFPINGNRLIDADGVWCYQIPMNLDYVQMNEKGEMVPSADISKGIPTRTSVRFRISKDDTGEEGFSSHTAKMLVPNNPTFNKVNSQSYYDDWENFEQLFEFGSSTRDEDYRDLYWNKVYSVKSYIPRFQGDKKIGDDRYMALKTANDTDGQNPVPFTSAKFSLPFVYSLVCLVITIIINIVKVLNAIQSFLYNLINWCIPGTGGIRGLPFGIGKILTVLCCPFKLLGELLSMCGITFDCTPIKGIGDDDGIMYIPGCYGDNIKNTDCYEGLEGCVKSTDTGGLIDKIEQRLAEYYNIIHLDFFNDWLNGCIYMPLWYWHKAKKKKFLFITIRSAANDYCSCDKRKYEDTKIWTICSPDRNGDFSWSPSEGAIESKKMHKNSQGNASVYVSRGIVKEHLNKNGVPIYYYTPILPTQGSDMNNITMIKSSVYSVRMLATDIILIGSLLENDNDGTPQLFKYLPPTSSNVIPMASTIDIVNPNEDEFSGSAADEDTADIVTTGMDWGRRGQGGSPKFNSGLLMDLGCTSISTRAKTCINLNRISELGVSHDMDIMESFANQSDIGERRIYPDGMITKYELFGDEYRAMFATLNHNGFNPKNERSFKIDNKTGYKVYSYHYMYPTNFDGRMDNIAKLYTKNSSQKTRDYISRSYISFRVGEERMFTIGHKLPFYNNSYYFYFGLNPGKTAIEKFNQKFNTACTKKNMEYFSMTTKQNSKTSCESVSNGEKAWIYVKVDNIQKPYSLIVQNIRKETIISEADINADEIVIKGESGTTTPYDKTTGKTAPYDIVYNDLDNDFYKIIVTDAQSHSSSKTVNLTQSSISVSYDTTNLGTTFKNEIETPKETFCNDKDLFGTIAIKTITIDSKEYYIRDWNILANSDGLSLTGTTSDLVNPIEGEKALSHKFKVEVSIGKDSDFDSVEECTCYDSQLVPNSVKVDASDNLVFSDYRKSKVNILKTTSNEYVKNGAKYIVMVISRPSALVFDVSELCINKDTGNEMELEKTRASYQIPINNGYEFEGFVGNVPFKMLIDPNKDTPLYKKNVASELSTTDTYVQNFMSMHKPSVYTIPSYPLTESNKEYWSQFVDFNMDIDMNPLNPGSENYEERENVNKLGRSKILLKQLQFILEMSRYAYEQGNGKGLFEITTTGGSKPIKYEIATPNITSIEAKTRLTATDRYNLEFKRQYDRPSFLPDIVSDNFRVKAILEPYESPEKSPSFNPMLFSPLTLGTTMDRKSYPVGAYYSVFDKNGSNKSQRLPQKIEGLTEEALNVEKNKVPQKIYSKQGNTAPWFNFLTTDRRLDYNLVVNEINDFKYFRDSSIQNQSDYDILCGFRVSGITYNGVEMSYDNEGNIIGKQSENLEYYYDNNVKQLFYNESAAANKNKRFLKATADNTDITNCFYSTNYQPTKIGKIEGSDITVNTISNYMDYVNGAYSPSNYPTKRAINLSSSKAISTITIESCDYASIKTNMESIIVEEEQDKPTAIPIKANLGESSSSTEIDLNTNIGVTFNMIDRWSFFIPRFGGSFQYKYGWHFGFTINDMVENNLTTYITKPIVLPLNNMNNLKVLRKLSPAEAIIKAQELQKEHQLYKFGAFNINIESETPLKGGKETFLYSLGKPIEVGDGNLGNAQFSIAIKGEDFSNGNSNKIMTYSPNYIAIIYRTLGQSDGSDGLSKKIDALHISKILDMRPFKITYLRPGTRPIMDYNEEGVEYVKATTDTHFWRYECSFGTKVDPAYAGNCSLINLDTTTAYLTEMHGMLGDDFLNQDFSLIEGILPSFKKFTGAWDIDTGSIKTTNEIYITRGNKVRDFVKYLSIDKETGEIARCDISVTFETPFYEGFYYNPNGHSGTLFWKEYYRDKKWWGNIVLLFTAQNNLAYMFTARLAGGNLKGGILDWNKNANDVNRGW